jgi:hypothetical protein
MAEAAYEVTRRRVPKYNPVTLTFDDPNDATTASGFKEYRINESFPFYATAIFALFSWAMFANVAGGLNAYVHGTSSQLVTVVCLFHVTLANVIVIVQSSLSRFISTDQQYLLSLRQWLQDLYIISEVWAQGGLLINRCYRGDCAAVYDGAPDFISEAERTNFCNPYGSKGLLPYDMVFTMALFGCLNQFLFRGSSWTVIVFTWLQMLVVVGLSYYFAANHVHSDAPMSPNNIVPTCVCFIPILIMYVIDKNLCDQWTIKLLECAAPGSNDGHSTDSASDPSKISNKRPTTAVTAKVKTTRTVGRNDREGSETASLPDAYRNPHDDSGRLGNSFIEENFGVMMKEARRSGKARNNGPQREARSDRLSLDVPLRPSGYTKGPRSAILSERDADGNLTKYPERNYCDVETHSDDLSEITV